MAQHVSSKNLLLSSRPLIVGVPASAGAWQAFLAEPQETQSAACDLVELRLDQLGLDPDTLLAQTTKLPLPFLVTARHPAEGGLGDLDGAARQSLLRPFIGKAAIMDIELRCLAEMRDLAREAQTAGTAVLGSFHDFERTPSEEVLEGAAAMAEAAGVEAVKVATFLNSAEDLARLLLFASRPRRLRVVAMGMGKLGPISRLTLAKCGSLLNYGYLGPVGNAPGQWPAARLKAVLAEL
jgi:3-dehydroquinate dehydratase I